MRCTARKASCSTLSATITQCRHQVSAHAAYVWQRGECFTSALRAAHAAAAWQGGSMVCTHATCIHRRCQRDHRGCVGRVISREVPRKSATRCTASTEIQGRSAGSCRERSSGSRRQKKRTLLRTFVVNLIEPVTMHASSASSDCVSRVRTLFACCFVGPKLSAMFCARFKKSAFWTDKTKNNVRRDGWREMPEHKYLETEWSATRLTRRITRARAS